jgi:hypothetical protein
MAQRKIVASHTFLDRMILLSLLLRGYPTVNLSTRNSKSFLR